MPSKRSPSKRAKTRRLWLGLSVKAPDHSLEDALGELLRRLKRGDHSLPPGWTATVRWSNGGPFQAGDWTTVLDDSAESTGWDRAMIGWIQRRL